MNGRTIAATAMEEILNTFPDDQIPAPVKARFASYCRHLDNLGLLDEKTQEVFIDEDNLRRMLKEHFPPEFEEECVTRLREIPDSKLLSKENRPRGQDKLTPIPWQALAGRVEALRPSTSPLSFEDFGGSAGRQRPFTAEEIRLAVKKRFPEIPDAMADPESFSRKIEDFVHGRGNAELTAIPGDIWDCMVRNLGWWGAMSVFVVVGAAIAAISLASGGLATAAAWSVFWALTSFGLAGSTLTLVGNCILNPWR